VVLIRNKIVFCHAMVLIQFIELNNLKNLKTLYVFSIILYIEQIICIIFMIFLNDIPYLSRIFIFDYSKNSNNTVNAMSSRIKEPIVRPAGFVCDCGRKIANFALELRFEKPIFALVLEIAFHYGSQSIKLRNGFHSRAHTHTMAVYVPNNIVSFGLRV